MSPVFVLAAGLIGLLVAGLAITAKTRSSGGLNWTTVSLAVGLVTVLVASGLFILMIYVILGESGGTT